MPSETDCLNDALGQIGAATITSIDDGSTNANWCKIFYPPLRQGLIRSHHWNFSLTRVELALDAAAPTFGFAYAFTLPPENLKVVDYGGAGTYITPTGVYAYPMRYPARYKIERGKLLSNDGRAWILYLRDVENPDEWDALFYQVVVTQLASKLAAAIPKDMKKSAELLSQAVNVLLPLALASDGQEGSTEPFVVDDLTWGR